TVSLGIGNKATSIAAADLKTLIELYVAYFNRVPDAQGLEYWIDQFKAGQSIEQIGKSFYAAAILYSSVTGYAASMTNADFVKIIYKNVLGRSTVDQEGLDYWTNSLANGSETRGTLIRTILWSAHTFKGDATYGYVADLLDNKVTVANNFTVQQGLSYNTATDSISKGMAIAAAVTPTGVAAALKLIGVSDALFNLAPTCMAPAVLQNGACVTPANNPLRPVVRFDVAVSPGGDTYMAVLCWDPSQCDELGDSVFVSTAEILASNGEVTADVAAADRVATEFNNMIGRLWAAKTFPPGQTILSVLRNAVATALANEDAASAVPTAAAGFAAAGYPAAGGGATGTSGSGTSATDSSGGACSISNYNGPNTDPQFDTFCQNAFINTCLDQASGTTTYQAQTQTVCTTLDGFLKAVGSGTAANYCGYCR
ncbi:MAG TPA: DUF4214 domain-containing protein, partial [Burkholderiaceae bacterium]|nr:DUF4214 domain-containing protein [Burkholderiaceae bacterium]